MAETLHTEIIIRAGRDRVWNILMDFKSYPEWNPFIVQIEGEPVKGKRLRNTLRNGDKTYVFKPRILELEAPHRFSWLGSLWFRGLFDGRHQFGIEDLGDGQVKLVHSETFSGILSGMILRKIREETRNNFIRMNEALKKRAESWETAIA